MFTSTNHHMTTSSAVACQAIWEFKSSKVFQNQESDLTSTITMVNRLIPRLLQAQHNSRNSFIIFVINNLITVCDASLHNYFICGHSNQAKAQATLQRKLTLLQNLTTHQHLSLSDCLQVIQEINTEESTSWQSTAKVAQIKELMHHLLILVFCTQDVQIPLLQFLLQNLQDIWTLRASGPLNSFMLVFYTN